MPSGRIMVYDDDCFYGYGRDRYPGFMGGQWRRGESYHLFASPRSAAEFDPDQLRARVRRMRQQKGVQADVAYRWTQRVPVVVRAMALAGPTLFIAGPPDVEKPRAGDLLELADPAEALAAFQGQRGATLRAVSAADGSTLAEYQLASPPVWDGMAAAGGRLYLVTKAGEIVCFAGK
jgi:hypothetical protein